MNYKKIEFLNNDIYLLSSTKDYIVINNNYRGLLVLNHDLEFKSNIDLSPDTIIDCVFSHENMLLMFCSERNLFIYIDLVTGYYKQIPIDVDNWICSPIYEWRGDKVTLFNYSGKKLIIDIKYATVYFTEKIHYRMKELISKKIISFNYIEGIAVGGTEEVEVLNCKTGNIICRIPVEGSYHDYEIRKSYFMEIGESNVVLLSNQKKRRLQPNENYFFMRGKFFTNAKEEGIILLSGDKSNVKKCLLEKYCFS